MTLAVVPVPRFLEEKEAVTTYDGLTGRGPFYPPGDGPPPKSAPHRYEIWLADDPSPYWDGHLIFEARDLAELEEIVRTEDLRTRPGEVVRVVHAVKGRNLTDFERRHVNRSFRRAGLQPQFLTDAELKARESTSTSMVSALTDWGFRWERRGDSFFRMLKKPAA